MTTIGNKWEIGKNTKVVFECTNQSQCGKRCTAMKGLGLSKCLKNSIRFLYLNLIKFQLSSNLKGIISFWLFSKFGFSPAHQAKY